MNIFSLLICWTFMYAFLANSVAEDQQLMVCKPLSSVFETRPTNSTNQFAFSATNQGCGKSRPGKQGPRGLRGPPGPIGPPGETVTQNNETERLQEEVQVMERKMQCMDGVLVGNTCYKLPYRVGVGVDYETARSLCVFHGMGLAEISTEEVYDAVHDYVQKNWYLMIDRASTTFVDVWLGSSYDMNGNVILPNGQQGFVRWFPGHPTSRSGYTRVLLEVAIKPQNTQSGMWNNSPTYSSTSVPICQFQI